ncbi:hypothetical protein QTO34_005954 [Cnephaeus nilssonii]|uniref:EGF-like calcium-binding domain-containing protein n=1 Tax=Cnephaeus nilssonii TaxID=3371016 RepID=A0AA40LJ18_CNENI|nr:hypothetical protein QTO34_005954 [Eptesicus nilssonii]
MFTRSRWLPNFQMGLEGGVAAKRPVRRQLQKSRQETVLAGNGWWQKNETEKQVDRQGGYHTNECIQFPFVCPRDKPVCVNTYGSYRCRTNKKCSRGYEPNEDGTACVGESALAAVQ